MLLGMGGAGVKVRRAGGCVGGMRGCELGGGGQKNARFRGLSSRARRRAACVLTPPHQVSVAPANLLTPPHSRRPLLSAPLADSDPRRFGALALPIGAFVLLQNKKGLSWDDVLVDSLPPAIKVGGARPGGLAGPLFTNGLCGRMACEEWLV